MSQIPFSEMHRQHAGNSSDKWTHYLGVYNRLLNEYRDQAINLLEIGVFNGGSLEIWHDYFANAQHIVGCDIDEKCREIQFAGDNIDLIIGDVKSDTTLAAVTAISPEYDIIIDDGSHRSSDIITAFVKLFPLLKTGGIFIIEDLHCSYWHGWEGGLDKHDSSMAFLKCLADVVNHEHWDVQAPRTALLQPFLAAQDAQELDLASIHSVEFSNSMCIIRKRAPQDNVLGKRVICGQTFAVNDLHTAHGTLTAQPPKQERQIATDLISQMQQQLLQKDHIIQQQYQQLQQLVQHIQHLQAAPKQ